MAEKGKRSRGGLLLLLLLLAGALVALRFLGPGGSPAKETAGPAPAAPPPAAAPEAGAPSPVVRGRVLSSGGEPLPGATLEALFDVEGAPAPVVLRSGPTGPDGTFALAGAPPSWKGLRLRAVRGNLSVDADLGEGGAGLEADLRMPDVLHVAGRVVAAEDGRPLEGMEVLLGGRTAVTGPDGRFSFPSVPAAEVPGAIGVAGEGRRPYRRALPGEGGLDDLLLSVERP